MVLGLALPLLGLASWLGLEDAPLKLTKTVDSAVVVIRVPGGGGSGFLAFLDGKKYIVTNQHVLMGAPAPDVHIFFNDGTEAHPTKPEIVGDLDLARIEIATDREPLKCAAGNPALGTHVLAVGNSLDAGVITAGAGTIRGVGDTEIEVDCDFVPGNSGGPIVDPSNSALAVATYIRFGEKDAATAGTRYEKSRRFAVRVHDGMAWTPITQWPAYAAVGAKIHEAQRLSEEVAIAAQAIDTNTDLALFKPKTPKVISALADFDRLQAQFNKQSGQRLTEQRARSNNTALAATYRSAFQKLRDACSSSAKELEAYPIPKPWGWLDKQRKTTVEQLETIQTLLEAELKKIPS